MVYVIDDGVTAGEVVKEFFAVGVEVDVGGLGERMGREVIEHGLKMAALGAAKGAKIDVSFLLEQPLIARVT